MKGVLLVSSIRKASYGLNGHDNVKRLPRKGLRFRRQSGGRVCTQIVHGKSSVFVVL